MSSKTKLKAVAARAARLGNVCRWLWGGDKWHLRGNDCGGGDPCCSPPDYPGTFIGQPAATACTC